MALDATVGGASSNSYVSVADADAILANSLDAGVWNDTSTVLATEIKESALITATRILDMNFEWDGTIADSDIIDQALRWPRDNATDQDNREIPSTIIPTQLQVATSLFANYIQLQDGYKSEINTLNKVKVGSISVDFNTSNGDSVVPRYVIEELRGIGNFIGKTGGQEIAVAKLVRT